MVPGKYGKNLGCTHLCRDPTLGITPRKEADAGGRKVASRSGWQHGAAQGIQTATSLEIFRQMASESLPEGSRTLSGSA